MKPLLITIDGPAGAGKTTVSRMLAKQLDYRYIDTGALYRGIAFEVKAADINPADDAAIEKLCASLHLRFIQEQNNTRLLSNDTDITDKLRTPEITMLSSAVSAKPIVRKYLLNVQREMGKEKSAVFEGRDMGTVVFPDADVKFFLDASLDARALRRYNEFLSDQTLEEIQNDIRRRDENDSTRSIAPLKPADDAVIIDTTALSCERVVEQMRSYVQSFRE